MPDDSTTCRTCGNRAGLLLAVVFGALGVAMMLWVTRWGAGTEPDSVVYLAAARSLADGKGLTVPAWHDASSVPMTHFPPLLPTLLAGLAVVGIDPFVGVRILNAVMFGGTLATAAWLLGRATRRFWLAAAAALLLLNAVHLIDVHVMAMSEGLFLLLALWAIVALAKYFDSSSWLTLIISALLVGAAFLTRYVGAALVAGGGAALFFFGPRKWKRRIIDCIVFGLVSCLPMAMWVVRNKLASSSAANREAAFHPITMAKLTTGAMSMSRWFVPQSMPNSVKLAAVAALLVLLAAATLMPARRADRAKPALHRTGHLLGIFIAAYVALLVVSISFFDAHTPLDIRLLSPLHLATVVLALLGVDKLLRCFKKPRIPAVVLGLVLAAFLARQARQNVSENILGRNDAEGFSSRTWRQSRVIDRVAKLPPQTPVYSNWPEAIYLVSRRTTCVVPFKADPYTRADRPELDADLKALGQSLQTNGGVLVWFTEGGRWYLPSLDRVRRHVPLAVDYEDDHGRIFRNPSAAKTDVP